MSAVERTRSKKMINMDKKEQILHYHRIDGLSLREISRRVGLNRKTVTRYIREYEVQVLSDPEEGIDMCLASKPVYPSRKTGRTKLTEAVCAEIEYWLSENAKRRQTGMRKQCLKRQDIHRALIEKGFSISYSSVCKYIQQRKAEKRSKPKDVFIKQYYEPGEECEFDWGEVKLRIAGKQVTFTMAVFALCHSEPLGIPLPSSGQPGLHGVAPQFLPRRARSASYYGVRQHEGGRHPQVRRQTAHGIAAANGGFLKGDGSIKHSGTGSIMCLSPPIQPSYHKYGKRYM